MKFLIVGLVRDVANVLHQQVTVIDSAFSDCGETSWFLVESDSKDSTISVLDKCRQVIPHFDYCSLGSLAGSLKERTVRLAHCRNKYMELVDDPIRGDCDYVVVVDLDNANNLLTAEKVRAVLDKNGSWDVVTANQLGPYYDLWALRHSLWCPVDCDQAYRFFIEIGVAKSQALQSAVLDKMLRIPSNGSLIQVKSAFGGLGIYKKKTLVGRRYVGIDDKNQPVCEHVPLNISIADDGYRICIASSLINAGLNEHSRRGTRAYKILRAIKSMVLKCNE